MVKIKYKPLIIVLVIILFVCIISFFVIRNFTSPKSFDDLLGTNDTNISTILMLNGNNRNNGYSVSTNDKTKIKELVTLVNNRYYRRSPDQRERSGYNYYVYTFYVGNKEVLSITGTGNYVYINHVYYDVNEGIETDKITDWFNSFPVTR